MNGDTLPRVLELALALLAGLAGAAANELARRRRRPSSSSGFESKLRETVILHLHTGDSLGGILAATYADAVLLDRPRLLEPGNETPVTLDGELVIPIARVKYAQTGPVLDDVLGLLPDVRPLRLEAGGLTP